MREYTIPVIAGDGVGPEVIAEGKKVLEAAADADGFAVRWIQYPFGAEHYLSTGELVSDRSLAELSKYKTIYFGACGDPRVPPGVLEKGIVIAIRMYFDQYVNVRPVKLFAGITGVLRDKGPADIDFVVIRENTEDFYVDIGGRCSAGTHRQTLALERKLFRAEFAMEVTSSATELAYQVGVLSREGTRRILEYAFELARKRRQRLASIDKANVLSDMYGLWRAEVNAVASNYPDVVVDHLIVDAATMWMIRQPEMFDVVVAPNMFGDILTDLGAAIQGGLGIGPGANLNPKGTSMFEPIHGSAPPLKGTQTANPIATIWSGAMMLDFLGEAHAASAVLAAIETNVAAGRVRTPDLGGTNSTAEVGDDIAARVRRGVAQSTQWTK